MESNSVNSIVLILLIIGTLIFLKCCNGPIDDINEVEYYNPHFDIKSHTICPVMENDTKITACIHYPRLNLGFICSVCCDHCIAKIQKSFKNEDKEYDILKKDNKYYLTKKGDIKQEVILCNYENFKNIVSRLGTKTLND
jgi:hypothetical protein|tara:strand:+ start:1084 stop:1503 length:420 start_codon:yes stop_codon:yes gene_type:complete